MIVPVPVIFIAVLIFAAAIIIICYMGANIEGKAEKIRDLQDQLNESQSGLSRYVDRVVDMGQTLEEIRELHREMGSALSVFGETGEHLE